MVHRIDDILVPQGRQDTPDGWLAHLAADRVGRGRIAGSQVPERCLTTPVRATLARARVENQMAGSECLNCEHVKFMCRVDYVRVLFSIRAVVPSNTGFAKVQQVHPVSVKIGTVTGPALP